ncbi:hypothetical protein ACFL04_00335 [Patescibacteria group bacterium]
MKIRVYLRNFLQIRVPNKTWLFSIMTISIITVLIITVSSTKPSISMDTEVIQTSGFTGTNFPHIKTWGIFVGGSVPGDDARWAATKFDVIGGALFSGTNRGELRAINNNLKICGYMSIPSLHDGSFANRQQWAIDNGYDYEDFFLHYKEDTWEDYWDRNAKGWRDECSPDSCTPTATAASPEEARVWGTWPPRPNWRFRNFNNQSLLYEVDMLGPWIENGPPDVFECIYLDSVPLYTLVLDLLAINKTHTYYDLVYDYDHPMIQAAFQFGVDYVEQVANQYGQSIIPIPNATASSTSLHPGFKTKFETMYDWVFIEVWMYYKSTLNYEDSYNRDLVQILDQTRAGEKRLLRANEWYYSPSDKGKMFILSSYHLINNENTYFDFRLAEAPEEIVDNPRDHWFNAIEYNIGYPINNPTGQADYRGDYNTSEHYEWTTGQDPSAPTNAYHILARHYSNALVLLKYKPKDSVQVNDLSATTHPLGNTYKKLNVDGTLGPVISEITLRNNEGAILIPYDSTAPATINNLKAR